MATIAVNQMVGGYRYLNRLETALLGIALALFRGIASTRTLGTHSGQLTLHGAFAATHRPFMHAGTIGSQGTDAGLGQPPQ